MINADNMSPNDLTDQFAQIIVSLVEDHGYKYPIHFAVVSRDGVVFGGTFRKSENGDVECDITAEQSGMNAMRVPISVMYIDSETGHASLVQITTSGYTIQ